MASQLDPPARPAHRDTGNDQDDRDDQRGGTAEQSAGGQQASPPTFSTTLDADAIEGVKRANSLLAVLTRYGIAVQGTGAHRMARCPFHDDKRPSLGVFLDTNRFFCFGCGANGDVIDLVQRVEAVGFREAVRRLAPAQAPAGVLVGPPQSPPVPVTGQPIMSMLDDADATGAQPVLPRALQQPMLHVLENTPSGEQHATHRITTLGFRGDGAVSCPSIDLALLTAAAGIYQATLRFAPSAHPARGYLRRRGIPPTVAQEAHLGYADGVSLLHYLGHDDELLRAAHRIGLLDEQGRECLRDRLIIPEFRAGLCLWLHGRLVDRPRPAPVASSRSPSSGEGDADGADSVRRPLLPVKYLGCALPKPLFGVGLCEQDRVEAKWSRPQHRDRALLVVEGAFDALAVRALRIPVRCVALIGTHAGPTQRRELLQLASGGPIWLSLDADAAGDAGAERLGAWLNANGYPGAIFRVRAPCGAKDLAELVELIGQRGARKVFIDTLRQCPQRTADAATPAALRDRATDVQVGVAHIDEFGRESGRSGRSVRSGQWGGDEEGEGGGGSNE